MENELLKLIEGVQVVDGVTSTLTDGVGPEGEGGKLAWGVVSGLLDGTGLREGVCVWTVWMSDVIRLGEAALELGEGIVENVSAGLGYWV